MRGAESNSREKTEAAEFWIVVMAPRCDKARLERRVQLSTREVTKV